MAKEFKLQDPGEGIHEAEVREVHVSSGDQVSDGDLLVTVETDKAVNEIDAPFSGAIKSVKVKAGQSISVGDVLLTYEPEEDSAEDEEEETGAQEEKAGAEEDEETEVREDEEEEDDEEDEKKEEREETKPGEEQEKAGEEKKENRQEKKKDKKEKKETRTISVAPEDNKAREKKKKASEEKKNGEGKKAGKKEAAGEDKKAPKKSRPVPAAPATRRLAREQGIDLEEVEGSGPGGRVTAEDLRAQGDKGKKEKGPKKTELPDFSQWGEVERTPLRSVRRATARQMSLSWSRIPHVMHREMADITELEVFRRQYRGEVADKGGKLTLTVLLMKAVAAALREFPGFNASLDEENEEIIIKNYHHMGVAVATDQGLLVPVIRDVDRKSVTELAVELTELAERARQGKLKREEMRGGTFTITNPGPIGGDSFTPIINYPEAAILGVGSARLEPVISGDMDNYELRPRLRVPLCLVYDHRLNDGAGAARFLHAIVETLRDPQSYLLAV